MKAEIIKFSVGPLKTNCYLVTNAKKNRAIIVDPGGESEELISICGEIDVDYILLTHCHPDHIAGLAKLRSITKGKVVAHHTEINWHNVMPDIQLKNEETTIKWEDISIQAIHTPGHSPGGISYLIEEALFTGDTLLDGLIGPTDIPEGDRKLLIKSIKEKLYTLPDHLLVYPGHGNPTTIGYEKANNIFPNLKFSHLAKDTYFQPLYDKHNK